MTREELELKAKEYALSKWEGQVPWGLIQQGYIEGYNEGRKENEKLKKQIETMKCCGNCKFKKGGVVETCRMKKIYTLNRGCCEEWEPAE